MSGTRIPTTRPPAFDARFGSPRETGERRGAHPAGPRPERMSLAERIEQALLEAERLHGD